MKKEVHFPKLLINLKKLESNAKEICRRCQATGIKVTGVFKGCSGLIPCGQALLMGGCQDIGSSRMEQLKNLKAGGVDCKTMLIRIPMLSEVEDLVAFTDCSLNSEVETLHGIEKECKKQNRRHKVILMVDLGDLREGFWSKEELIEAALLVENTMERVELGGVGTNLGCYGAVTPTREKLEELVDIAKEIEDKIGRKLEYVSGGATTSIPRILDGDMPEGINHLRIGEGILLGRDLVHLWGYTMDDMYQDVFTVEAEIIEIREKASYPIGKIMFDAFGNRPEYDDLGMRKKALLALGKVDYAYLESLFSKDERIKILGASSDHTILDVEEVEEPLNLGDTVQFDISYGALVFLTNSPNVMIQYVN